MLNQLIFKMAVIVYEMCKSCVGFLKTKSHQMFDFIMRCKNKIVFFQQVLQQPKTDGKQKAGYRDQNGRKMIMIFMKPIIDYRLIYKILIFTILLYYVSYTNCVTINKNYQICTPTNGHTLEVPTVITCKIPENPLDKLHITKVIVYTPRLSPYVTKAYINVQNFKEHYVLILDFSEHQEKSLMIIRYFLIRIKKNVN